MKKMYIALGAVASIIFIALIAFFVILPNKNNTSNTKESDSTSVSGSYKKAELVGTPRVRASGLEAPWSLVFYNDSVLVSLRDKGEIREILDNEKTRLVGRISGIEHVSEDGLLGMIVNTSNEDPYLYVYYSTSGDNRIVRYVLSGKKGSLKLGKAEVILSGISKAANHNGGRIAFGPDGMLYATTGDAGDPSSAQDRNSLNGKILRMTADGNVPKDNPFQNSLVYSYGHRNPQGIAWSTNGTMYATEFGQNKWDELNEIKPGRNYGWPTHEGKANTQGFVDPVQQWTPAEASPSGMAFYNGVLFIANLRGTVLRAVATSALQESLEYFSGKYGRIRDVVISPKNELWFITNNTDGRGNPEARDDRVMSVSIKK
ncbi:PQQ-dependent sugar dehydrogenase [Liquorilactobacillus uvarum]|uniref:Glucose/Sorbosone dehydrogenase domain-containing protein n=1 Tax=Liquorilactobacillus uvarum DSM 19971 TaxID=1423812 RepID=A0A0R1Q0B1_9LACO|nr:PQQ-dependent sugar dehydrogenase [Liquorilactobacillus uvarum]KRL38167.1 hypothetical protein FD20_GL002118 [Liquorilactobacillus uvarum DSM 19971]